jgi:hypothetical protein
MSKADEYRRSAASLLDLAQRADGLTDKNRLLRMAEAWLDLAHRATKITEACETRDHSLIGATLGRAEAK